MAMLSFLLLPRTFSQLPSVVCQFKVSIEVELSRLPNLSAVMENSEQNLPAPTIKAEYAENKTINVVSFDYFHFPFLNSDIIIHSQILELAYFSFLFFFPSNENIVLHRPSKRDVTRNGFCNREKIIKTAEGLP